MQKIKKGDEVYILTGKDKGRRGKVLNILSKGKDFKRLIVEGINMSKKHVRPNPQQNQQGGILEKESAISISNVAIYNASTGKGDRVGFKTLKDGKKVRVFKSNNEIIDI